MGIFNSSALAELRQAAVVKEKETQAEMLRRRLEVLTPKLDIVRGRLQAAQDKADEFDRRAGNYQTEYQSALEEISKLEQITSDIGRATAARCELGVQYRKLVDEEKKITDVVEACTRDVQILTDQVRDCLLLAGDHNISRVELPSATIDGEIEALQQLWERINRTAGEMSIDEATAEVTLLAARARRAEVAYKRMNDSRQKRIDFFINRSRDLARQYKLAATPSIIGQRIAGGWDAFINDWSFRLIEAQLRRAEMCEKGVPLREIKPTIVDPHIVDDLLSALDADVSAGIDDCELAERVLQMLSDGVVKAKDPRLLAILEEREDAFAGDNRLTHIWRSLRDQQAFKRDDLRAECVHAVQELSGKIIGIVGGIPKQQVVAGLESLFDAKVEWEESRDNSTWQVVERQNTRVLVCLVPLVSHAMYGMCHQVDTDVVDVRFGLGVASIARSLEEFFAHKANKVSA